MTATTDPLRLAADGQLWPMTRARLLAFLATTQIEATTVEHPPIFTVAEGAAYKAQWPGGRTKNLFLAAGDALVLVCELGDSAIKVNALHRLVGTKRLSFGAPDVLFDALGARPGSVSLFALANDRQNQVRVLLDHRLFAHQRVYFHPLENTASTAIAPVDMLRFVRACGQDPLIVDFARLERIPIRSKA